MGNNRDRRKKAFSIYSVEESCQQKCFVKNTSKPLYPSTRHMYTYLSYFQPAIGKGTDTVNGDSS